MAQWRPHSAQPPLNNPIWRSRRRRDRHPTSRSDSLAKNIIGWQIDVLPLLIRGHISHKCEQILRSVSIMVHVKTPSRQLVHTWNEHLTRHSNAFVECLMQSKWIIVCCVGWRNRHSSRWSDFRHTLSDTCNSRTSTVQQHIRPFSLRIPSSPKLASAFLLHHSILTDLSPPLVFFLTLHEFTVLLFKCSIYVPGQNYALPKFSIFLS